MLHALEPAIILCGLGVAAAIIVLAMKLAIGLPRKLIKAQEEASTGDEARMIQQMYETLSRLEVRVESLETILVDSERVKR